MKGSDRDDTPVLITEAAPSYEEQHQARKRKYAIIMGARIPCLVLAGIFINTWWLALFFVVLSVPLPWVAVLIANDRPPRKSEEINRFKADRAARRALEAKSHQVIDGG
ncbi:DUF3099 domain-containing protein [Kutzneria viridogrisea]|uniref:DUF3099 domain-containing protein n=2 Tax=Kutzneria TaxID=43356 RepID=W5WHA3_9PSEU|nr:DUF3099 domain-containing protein [Kutzneria albida]AHI00218.1 hypothetical protein KALB_6859 [Kutzneria albida DSM 43870]MBA8925394.1 hypothetical protein [Kutzneria viridogrisea]